jgi:hypothetical protein
MRFFYGPVGHRPGRMTDSRYTDPCVEQQVVSFYFLFLKMTAVVAISIHHYTLNSSFFIFLGLGLSSKKNYFNAATEPYLHD